MERRDVCNVRDLSKKIALFEGSSFSSACTSNGSNIEKFMWGLDGVKQEKKIVLRRKIFPCATLVKKSTTWTDLNTNLGPVVRCR
jgi:hypothetical protein